MHVKERKIFPSKYTSRFIYDFRLSALHFAGPSGRAV